MSLSWQVLSVIHLDGKAQPSIVWFVLLPHCCAKGGCNGVVLFDREKGSAWRRGIY
jgi:hypothetical protein